MSRGGMSFGRDLDVKDQLGRGRAGRRAFSEIGEEELRRVTPLH